MLVIEAIRLGRRQEQDHGRFHPDPICVTRLVMSPDGRWLLLLDSPVARVQDLRGRWQPASLAGWDADTGLLAAFTPDGRAVATAGTRGWVHVWSLPSGQRSLSLAPPGNALDVTALAFSPDGTSLAAAYGDRVQRWTVAMPANPTAK